MHRRLDKYLVTRFQPLYRERYGNMQTTAMCWGFEVGNGWFNLIDTLSYNLCYKWERELVNFNKIVDRVGQLKYPDVKQDQYNQIITQLQVDEQFERVVSEYNKVPVATQVKEKYGTLRFYVHGASDEHAAIIDFAELLSAKTCEQCGARGKTRGMGWLSTTCTLHVN